MTTLDIFFAILGLNCLLFVALCIYSSFLTKKEVKDKTTKFDYSYDAMRFAIYQEKQKIKPLHYNCRSFNCDKKPEGTDYMKFTITDGSERKCNSKDEV